MLLGIDMGFWYGMAAVATATLTGVIVAWSLPAKKEASNERNLQQLEKEE